MGKSKLYVIMELDNIIYDFTNHYINFITNTSHLLNDIFGINSDEFIENYINYISNNPTNSEDYITTVYKILNKFYSKSMIFDNSSSKRSFCNTLRSRIFSFFSNNLYIFPGVLATIDRLKKMGVIFIGFSNSPSTAVSLRLKTTKIDKFFDTVYAVSPLNTESSKIKDKNYLSELWLSSTKINISSIFCEIISLPSIYSKPSIKGFQRILEDFGYEKDRFFVIGPSIENDIVPAKIIGIQPILFNNKIKIKNLSFVRKMLKKMDAKNVRKILKIYNNKNSNEVNCEHKAHSFIGVEKILSDFLYLKASNG